MLKGCSLNVFYAVDDVRKFDLCEFERKK